VAQQLFVELLYFLVQRAAALVQLAARAVSGAEVQRALGLRTLFTASSSVGGGALGAAFPKMRRILTRYRSLDGQAERLGPGTDKTRTDAQL
jgi:hypothetical protein